jgi:colicin import membrane protein
VVFERKQPGQWKAGALALLVHVLFLGLMIFGVSWQNQEQAGVEVELWSEVPAPAKVAPPPRPAPAPRPEPKPEPRPAPPEPKPEPKQLKADIELKAKEEEKKKRREEELKQKQEKQKQEEDKRKQEQDKKLQQEKQEALRQKQAEAEAANARKAEAAAQQAAGQRVLDDYTGRIKSKIKRFIILPPDLAGNPQAEFDVTLMPTGEVLNLKLTRSSGSAAYDSAVERAIYKAQPLPLPPDPGLFGKFRELHLKFRLNED